MWNAERYEKFEKERMQPSIDLVNRIECREFERILDVGCGSGMSTVPLRKRFSKAEIIGVDMSITMLEKAKKTIHDVKWEKRDCREPFNDLGKFDLVFSNAFLQWVNNQEEVIKNIREGMTKNGIFAIQIPNFEEMELSKLIKETADEFDEDNQLFYNKKSTCFNYPIARYYDMFANYFSDIEIWQTEYVHQMKNCSEIVDFVKGTALIPYLDCLNETQGLDFMQRLHEKVKNCYKESQNGTVLFGFKRIFIMAKKN